METKISKPGSYQRIIEVDLPPEELAPHFDVAYRKYQKNIRLEGFRKGKVPLSLVKKIYGKEIQSEAIEDVIKSVFKEISDRENLKPVTPAKVENFEYEPEKGLHFKAVVDVVPDIELKNYKGISVEQEVYQVGEEDVKAALEEVRERMAVMNPVEEAAEEDHFILADLQEIDISGVPVIGNKYEDRFFQLNNSEFTHELTEQLKGVKPGETRRVQISASQEAGDRNKENKFYNVIVKEIKEKQLPDLNDELAKDFGNFANLEALKADLKKKLIKQHETNSMYQVQRAIRNEIAKKNMFDIPESMIKNYLDILIEDIRKRNNNYNEDIDEPDLRENYRTDAISEIRWRLIKDKIVDVENIEVYEDDKSNYIDRISAEQGIDEKQLSSSLKSREAQIRFKEDVLEKKVLDFLKLHAKIKERKITRKDIERAQKLAIPN